MPALGSRIAITVVVALATATAAAGANGVAGGPLRSAVVEPDEIATTVSGPEAEATFSRMKAIGATAVITRLSWASTAPAQLPSSFDATNPNDPAYDWSGFDAKVKALVAHGFEPLVTVNDAPAWGKLKAAQPNSPPKPDAMGAFMKAAATHYSGTTPGIPRVRYWQIWIEPNLSNFFVQANLATGQFTSPDTYRAIVNASYDAIHSVRADDVVMAGGTAPFRDITPEILKINQDWGPLTFMRALFCLDADLKPTCGDRIKFDVWTHHPYTSGGPTHHANLADDVSLGDLGKMRAVLDAGVKTGHIATGGSVQFWVTEFSWDSNPPDPNGVPMKLLQRWVAEGMYRMWLDGVSLVAWLQLRDAPMNTSFVQSGLYFQGPTMAASKPKPALEAFRFPVTAFKASRGRVDVWGRTPTAKAGRVVVEQQVKGRWAPLGTLAADRNGIFRRRFAAPRASAVRARMVAGRETSLPFSLTPVPDKFFCAFGYCGLTDPSKP